MKLVKLGVASVATRDVEVIWSRKDPISVGTVYGPKPT